MSEVVTRFAPSPTGKMHLGNVRTALLNWLFAHQQGGKFLLRFEDTDQDRSEQQYIDAIEQDLQWLGLNWDGPALFQSKHAAAHQQALQSLAEKGLAYRCFCSESQLAIDRKLATSRGLPPRYAGRCRQLSETESAQRAETEAFVWRLAIHDAEGEVVVPDLLRNDVQFARRDLDDPVVVRSDGSFTFLLPNAIDDAMDGITHALRGDDHLTNSAYQVWLLQELGHTVPVYLHHGLLQGQDGAKLSKRSGSHSVEELRKDGLLPEALLQAMTRLGHPNISEDITGAEALAQAFSAKGISTSAVKWSDAEMWRWHTRLLHQLDLQSLAELIAPLFPALQEDRLEAFVSLIQGNIERIEQARGFARLLEVDTLLSEPALQSAQEAGAAFYQHALQSWLEQDGEGWKSWVDDVKQRTGHKGKMLFMPLRVALTGQMHGPEMSAVVQFLGRQGVQQRLEQCLEGLS